MKKKSMFLGLFIFLALFIVTGCDDESSESSSKKSSEKVEVKANQKVGNLNYYAPSDYTYMPEKRGLIYKENERKIFAKGSFDDYTTLVYIDVYVDKATKNLDTYISDVNEKLVNDVQYKKMNSNISVYGRETYYLKSNGVERVNYAYITCQSDYLYTVVITGPKSLEMDVESLAKQVLQSLSFN